MRKLGTLVVGLAGLLAMPGSAAAIADCQYAGGGAVEIYTVGASGGRTGDALVGVCADTGVAGANGGYIEVGHGDGNADNGGTYAVVDGSDQNGFTGTQGYVGLSDYEGNGDAGGTNRDPDCDGFPDDPDGGTNSGGCLVIKPFYGQPIPVPLLVCSIDPIGHDWADTPEDGCRTLWPDS